MRSRLNLNSRHAAFQRASAKISRGWVGKVLQGRNPAELPIERPTTFQLRSNLKTATLVPGLADERADHATPSSGLLLPLCDNKLSLSGARRSTNQTRKTNFYPRMLGS